MRSVFISYKYEDKPWKERIEELIKNRRLGDDIRITGESEDVRQGGEKAIKDHLGPKIRGASAILVLVGNDTHNSSGVDYEIQFAKSHHKKVVPVRIPDTQGGLPDKIRDKDVVAFEPEAITQAIE